MKTISEIKASYNSLSKMHDSAVSRALFYIPFGTWLFISIFVHQSYGSAPFKGIPHFADAFTLLNSLCILVIVLREIAFGIWSRVSFLGLVTFAFFVAIAHSSNYSPVVQGCFFVFAARNIPFRDLAKFSIAVMAAGIIIILLSCLTPYNLDTVDSDPLRPRHNLGFAHPNTGPALTFFLFCLWVYIRGERIGIADYAGIAVIAALLFFFTASRTFVVYTIVLAVVSIAWKLASKYLRNSGIGRALCVVSIAAIAIVQIWLSISFDPSVPFFAQVNTALSGRLSLWARAVSEYGITGFGSSVTASYPIDGAYIYVLTRFGIVFFLVGLALWTLVIKQLIEVKEGLLVLIVICVAAYGLSETCIILLWFNPFLFLCGQLFSDSVLDKSEKHKSPNEASGGVMSSSTSA